MRKKVVITTPTGEIVVSNLSIRAILLSKRTDAQKASTWWFLQHSY